MIVRKLFCKKSGGVRYMNLVVVITLFINVIYELV